LANPLDLDHGFIELLAFDGSLVLPGRERRKEVKWRGGKEGRDEFLKESKYIA
jgi:hypothetical protein